MALVVAQLALLAAAMLAGVMVAPYLSSPDSTFVVSREDAAIAACRKAVKEQLKAPATAQFIEEKTDDFNSYIEVTGAVDSQNSFGALLRNRFECHAVRQGDDWVGTQVTFSKA